MTPETPAPEFFGFRSDGSIAASHNQSHRQTTALIASLVHRRRTTDQSPASLVSLIHAADCAAAFRCIEHWQRITNPDLWSCAQTATSAEEAVKRCGRGAGAPNSRLGWYRHEWREPRASEGHATTAVPPDDLESLLHAF